MKFLYVFAIVALLSSAPLAMAADSGHSGHGGSTQTEPGGQTEGNIYEAVVEGYRLTYQFFDLPAGNKAGQEDMSKVKTHHLMLFLVGPDGKPTPSSQTGFVIQSPDGAEQKILAMAMGDGAGADVSLNGKGKFIIKSKSVVNGKTLIDQFTRTIK